MKNRVLVTYTSRHGGTAEIAEKVAGKIAEIIHPYGLYADVLPVDRVHSLDAYQAVVLGNAVYAGQWPKEAVTFLETYQSVLNTLPFWIFSSGPTGEGNPVDLIQGWRYPTAQHSLIDQIGPRDLAVFHGDLSIDKLNIGERLIIKVVKAPTGDFRDWDAITRWAATIAETLLSELSGTKDQQLEETQT
jgi:menaquinone-dependent protoporphyrinogen oxidase